MKELLSSIEVISKYNQMSIEDVILEFEEFSGQKIPEEAIESFCFSGLSNIHFLTSDFLKKYNLKNLFEA